MAPVTGAGTSVTFCETKPTSRLLSTGKSSADRPARQNLIAARFLRQIDLRRPQGGRGSPKNRTARSPSYNASAHHGLRLCLQFFTNCSPYCPGDDFFISRSRLMARQLSLDLRFFDLNCFSPELPSGRPHGCRREFLTMRGEPWPDCFLPSCRLSSTV